MQILSQYCTVFDSVHYIGSCKLLASPGKRRVNSCDPPGSLREPFIGAGGVGGPWLSKLTRDSAARCEIVLFSLASHTEKGTT
ncbi:hypothetical protein HaLaN_03698 [Haematococcus lacustris]|uniref:Uncharacterized protein n=1 Tax=Haematococcus lacustris TaxID=44745 RepID=A0A699YF68_HAELA|nr:hypothetical protein HaLaN_03698 [Haematococcus lacustris]